MMPWTVKDVDGFKKGLTPEQKKKWVSTANGVLKECQSQGGSDCEGKAIRIANSKFEWTDEQWEEHDEHFATKPQDKPGGSNVGKYKKGPFCGPAGGAPQGSYPVNTRARAISAIAYARHAPNPSGIRKCVCGHYPDLPACGKKEKSSMSEKIPKGALRFVSTGAHAFVEGEEDKQLNMVVYSGGVIQGHWYWNNLAIDLEGMSFPMERYPILENHDTAKKIGFTGKPIIDGRIIINPKTTRFVDTEESREFQKLSSEGFPYQSSLYAKPTSVERLVEGEKKEVNGQIITGPGTIWRNCEFKEASVCVFGWDSKTNSSVFSRDETEDVDYTQIGGESYTYMTDAIVVDNSNNKEVKEMPKTVKELQEKYPELVQKLTDDLSAGHSQELQAKDDEINRLKKENEKQGDRIDHLEKKDIIRTEREIKSEAMQIVNSKLVATDIPERLYEKIRRLVKHDRFVQDDVLDTEAYSKFVDDEIKDFEEVGVTKTVLGMGGTSKGDVDDAKEKLDKEDDDAIEKMLKMTGDIQ